MRIWMILLRLLTATAALYGLWVVWADYQADRACYKAEAVPVCAENPCRQWGLRYVILENMETLEARYKFAIALYNVGALTARDPEEKRRIRQSAMDMIREIKAVAPGYKDIGQIGD